jgi:hypothetical protein
MRYRRLKLDRRGDISSPIIVILVTVAALAVAGMAIAWMASTGSRASSQGSLTVVGTPTVTTSGTLYITVKNLGNAAVSITSVKLGAGSASVTQSINPGASSALTITLTGGSYTSGNTYQGTVVSDAGTVQFSAICQ